MVWNGIAAVMARFVVLGVAIGSLGGAQTIAAQEPNDITLSLGATTAQSGDTVEVTVSMAVAGEGPSSMIVFLAYDPQTLRPNSNEYELILQSFEPTEPVLDEDGNAITMRRAVRPSESLVASGFSFDSQEHHDQGVFGVVVFSQNSTAISAGTLFTVAFTVTDGLDNGTMTDVMGLTADNAIVIPDGSGGVTPASTSASDANGGALTYGFNDAVIEIGCDPPGTPAGVTATQNRSDGVQIGWSAVATTGAEYRVYRNTVNNAASALALGTEWQTSTSFLDVSALVPAVVPGDGCTVPDQVTEVSYFYWVRARTPEGCQGSLSANSAEGFRVQAKREQAASLVPRVESGGTLLLLLGLLIVMGVTRYSVRHRHHPEGA